MDNILYQNDDVVVFMGINALEITALFTSGQRTRVENDVAILVGVSSQNGREKIMTQIRSQKMRNDPKQM